MRLETHSRPPPASHAEERGAPEVAARAGIGLRAQHHAEILSRLPDVGWFEAHSENYFAAGGTHRAQLLQIRHQYPISLHGVGLSLGSTDPLNRQHLLALRQLVRAVEPIFVSEHLAWGSIDGIHLNDLLPLPCTEEALRHMSARLREVQDFLGRQLLIENISSYFRYRCAQAPEWEFLSALVHDTGCGLLLDVNNVFVNAMNHGFDAHTFLQGIPASAVQEIHLAGHTVMQLEGRDIRIDTHSTHVSPEVWRLYGAALSRFGPLPTLIEWDAEIPDFSVLEAEADQATYMLESCRAAAA